MTAEECKVRISASLLVLLLCSVCCGCATRAEAAEAVQHELKTVQQDEVLREVITMDEAPTYAEVLFREVPNSTEAANDFLTFISDLGINVKHVTIKEYGYGNYTLQCKFTDDAYSILIYVSPEPKSNYTKWYGQLKKDNVNLRNWDYVVEG